MQDKYVIGEREYTREELLLFGMQHYPKFYWIFRGVGLGLMAIGLTMVGIFVLLGIKDFSVNEFDISWIFYSYAIGFGVMVLIGFVFLLVSFKKIPEENYVKHAVDYFTKVELNKKAREARIKQRQEKLARKEENKDISQLIKYKELLDKGVITEEEFNQKKKELLGN